MIKNAYIYKTSLPEEEVLSLIKETKIKASYFPKVSLIIFVNTKIKQEEFLAFVEKKYPQKKILERE